ncbi:MAG: PAS domain S-box protein [Cyclobacteriaceae bacterium]
MPDSDRLLQAYVNSIDVGVCMLDSQGKVKMVNQKMMAICGLNMEEVLEKHFENFLPATEKAAHLIRAVVKGEKDEMPETELSWKNASQTRYLRANAQYLQTEAFGYCRVLFFKDVTEEVSLRNELQYQASILASVEDSIVVTDKEGLISYWNKAAERLFGHTASEMLGKPIAQFNPEFDFTAFYEAPEHWTLFYQDFEWAYRRTDGREVWANVKISPLLNKENEIDGFIGVAKNVTDKKKREQELLRKQQELANIIDSQTTYLIRTDLEGYFTFSNPSFKNKFHQFEDIIGTYSLETIIPEDHEKTYKMVEECLTHPGKMVPIEIRKPAPDGGYYTNYWEFVAITDEQGKPTEIQGVGYDISDRKKSEQKINTLNDFNRLLLDISTRFINLNYSELDERINEAMAAVTEFTGFERSFVYLFNEEKTLGHLTYEYCMPGVPPLGPENQVFPAEPFPWWMGKVLSGQTIEVRDLKNLPPEAVNEKQVLLSAGIKSVVAVSIIYQDDFLGYIGFSSISEHKSWNGESSSLLKLLGAIFANAVYRSRTGQALLESRNEYKLLADNITDMISRHDEDTRTLYVSPSCAELLGYQPEEMIGKSALEFVHPHEKEIVMSAVEDAIRHGVGHFTARLLRKDGSYIWTETYGKRVGNENTVELIATTRNIQKQREVEVEKDQLLQETQALNEQLSANEEELRQNLDTTVVLNEKLVRSERKFKGLLEKSFDAIVVYDEHGFVTYASPSAAVITGYEEMVGMHSSSFVLNEDRPEAEALLHRILEGQGERVNFEQRLKKKEGTIIWIEAIMTNLMDDPAVGGLVANFRDITDRKLAEQKIRDNEASLKIAQKVAKIGSWEVNLVSGEAEWSEEFYRIMGFRPGEHSPANTDFYAYVHPEDVEHVLSCSEEVFSQYKNTHITYRIYDTYGKLKYIDAHNIIMFNDQGQPEKILGTIQDVTRETELERLLDETSQIAKVGGWEVDLEKQQLTWTAETYRIHNLSPEEEIDVERAIDFYAPGDKEVIKVAYERLVKYRELYDLELRIILDEGNLKWVRITSGGYDIKDDKVVKVRGSFQDITSKKEQEEALSKYSKRLMLAVQTARIGIWELDMESGELSWNEQQHKIYGISPEQFAKDINYWKSLVHPDDVARAGAEMAKALNGKEVFNVEFRIIRPDGEVRYLDASARPIIDQEGRVVKIIGVNLDVTNIKQSEERLLRNNEELRKANSELDHFVYSTSHNLRAPLTSIMGIIQVIREIKKAEEQERFINLIEKSVHKLDETIQEISAYSKNNRLEINAEAVDFHTIIHDIADSLSFMENANELRLNVSIPDDLQFYSDISRLKIIFNNLLSNAVKYYNPNQEKPEVNIEIETQPGGIRLLVKDNGIGISQQYLDRIFDMFFRATNKASGSGLGLYIVKEAVEKLGGNILISSELSVGTTFTIYLPDLDKRG